MRKTTGKEVRALFREASMIQGKNPMEYAFLNNDRVFEETLKEIAKLDNDVATAILESDDCDELFQLFESLDYIYGLDLNCGNSIEELCENTEKAEYYYSIIFEAFANLINRNGHMFKYYCEDLGLR